MFLFGPRALTHLSYMSDGDTWDILLSESEMMFALPCTLRYVKGIHYQGLLGNAMIHAWVVMNNKHCVMSRLYKTLSLQSIQLRETEIGPVKIPAIDIQKSVLMAVPEQQRSPQQRQCLEQLAHIKENQPILDCLLQGRQQIHTKDIFFDGYKKPRYVPHDRIHWWVSEALGFAQPTYLRLMISPVAICAERFAKLSTHKQYALLCEEAMVLAIERYLIKYAAETDFALQALWQACYQLSDTDNPILQRLDELCTIGLIADHPDWLAAWGAAHRSAIKPVLQNFVSTCQMHMPQSFFEYIMYLRATRLTKVA